MAVHVSHASLPYPIRKARYSMLVPYLDADGDPLDPTTPDTEFSLDAASFGDCAEEVTTIAGSNGIGLMTFSGAETDGSALAVAFKVASGPKNTLATLFPRNLAILGSGTLSAGSSGGGTLGTILAYDVTGCFLRTTGGTGGGGTGGANNQARRIITYTVSTGAFTVSPNWETAPDATTTYDVLVPEGVCMAALWGVVPATLGRKPVIDASGLSDANTVKLGPTGTGTAQTARDIGASVIAGSLGATAKTDVGTVVDTSIANAGLASDATVTTVGTNVANIQTRLPAALTANGNMKSSLMEILTTALTETSGLLAAGFKKFFNIAGPVHTIASVDQSGDGFGRMGANGASLTALSTAAALAAAAANITAIRTLTDLALPAVAPAANGGLVVADASGYAPSKVFAYFAGQAPNTLVWAQAMAELASVPGVTGTTLAALEWIFALARNHRAETGGTETVYKIDGTTPLASSLKSDDGTTFDSAAYVTEAGP